MEVLGLVRGLLSPFQALLDPRGYYSRLRGLLDRYGIYIRGAIFFGSWIGVSILSFTLILVIEALRSLANLDIGGLVLSPFRALTYSIVFPVIPALVDSILIILVIAPFPRERSLLDVFVVRASTLLPYTLRVVILEVKGELTFASLVTASLDPVGLGLLLVGAVLTAYGLYKTIGTSLAGAVLGGFAPLAYKLAIALF